MNYRALLIVGIIVSCNNAYSANATSTPSKLTLPPKLIQYKNKPIEQYRAYKGPRPVSPPVHKKGKKSEQRKDQTNKTERWKARYTKKDPA